MPSNVLFAWDVRLRYPVTRVFWGRHMVDDMVEKEYRKLKGHP